MNAIFSAVDRWLHGNTGVVTQWRTPGTSVKNRALVREDGRVLSQIDSCTVHDEFPIHVFPEGTLRTAPKTGLVFLRIRN